MGKVDTKESGIGFDVRVVSTEASRTLIWAMKVKAVRDGLEFVRGVGTTTGAEAAGTKAGAPARAAGAPVEAALVASCLRA